MPAGQSWDLARCTGLGSCPAPTHSHPDPFPLGKLLLGSLADMLPAAEPPARPEPPGTKGVFSCACLPRGRGRGRGRPGAGQGAWQAAPAWPRGPGPLDLQLLFLFQPLEGCKASLLCRGQFSTLDFDLATRVWLSLERSSQLALGCPRGLAAGVTGDSVSVLLLSLSPTFQGHPGHSPLSDLFVSLSRVAWNEEAQ